MLANLPLTALNAVGIVRTLAQHGQAVFRAPNQPLLPIPVNDMQAGLARQARRVDNAQPTTARAPRGSDRPDTRSAFLRCIWAKALEQPPQQCPQDSNQDQQLRRTGYRTVLRFRLPAQRNTVRQTFCVSLTPSGADDCDAPTLASAREALVCATAFKPDSANTPSNITRAAKRRTNAPLANAEKDESSMENPNATSLYRERNGQFGNPYPEMLVHRDKLASGHNLAFE
ncbi:hypothetical protein ACEQUB_01329 [Ralstonia syzygii]